MEVNNRNIGLDILKILSMCGIIGLHLINQGGIYRASYEEGQWSYFIICLISGILFLSVDIFAMITGYLMSQRDNVKFFALIKLYGVTYFYIILVFLFLKISHLVNVDGIKDYVYVFFPMIRGRYWYLVCYSFMFMLIPYINKLIKSLTNQEFKKLITILMFMCSILPTLFMTDFFKLDNGYSALWLIVCYLFGAYVKRYGFNIKHRTQWTIVIANTLIMLFLSLLIKYHRSEILDVLFSQYSEQLPFQYISPFIVVNSILLVSLFSEIKCKWINKVKINFLIQRLSKATFGVYVMHIHVLIFDNLLKDAFVNLVGEGALKLGIRTIGVILLIFILCSLIEMIRYNMTVIFISLIKRLMYNG